MPDEQGVIFTRRASGLVRELSWFDVFVFVVAGPAASGVIFYSVSTAADFPGASLPLAFLVGLLIFFPITLLVALSSATMPRSGGLYIAVSRVLGPTIGYLSAMLLPYHKPEIYERSPVKWEVGGVPLMTILGAFTFAAGWFFLFLSFKNFSPTIMLSLIALMLVGLIIYLYQQRRNRAEGVDVSKIYSQVPPE